MTQSVEFQSLVAIENHDCHATRAALEHTRGPGSPVAKTPYGILCDSLPIGPIVECLRAISQLRGHAGRNSIHAQGLSNRSFGLAFMVITLAFVGVGWLLSGGVSAIGLGVATAFGLIACLLPAALLPLNRFWMQVADRLGIVSNFILLAVVFYLILTPTGLILRLFTKDPLDQGLDPDIKSYLQPVSRQTDASTLQDIF